MVNLVSRCCGILFANNVSCMGGGIPKGHDNKISRLSASFIISRQIFAKYVANCWMTSYLIKNTHTIFKIVDTKLFFDLGYEKIKTNCFDFRL